MKLVGYYPRLSDRIKAIRNKKLFDFIGGSEITRNLENIKGMMKDFNSNIEKNLNTYVFVCEELVKKEGEQNAN